jgi:hypothetical protein
MTENNHLRVAILTHVWYFERHKRWQQRNGMPMRCAQVGIVSLKLIQPAAIMAAGQNAEMAMELPDDGFELANALECEVAQVVDHVIGANGLVPQPDQRSIHLLSRRKWAVAVTDDVGVAEVVVSREPKVLIRCW